MIIKNTVYYNFFFFNLRDLMSHFFTRTLFLEQSRVKIKSSELWQNILSQKGVKDRSIE